MSSYVELGSAEDRWFSPQNCIERAKANVDNLLQLSMLNNINLSNNDLEKCFSNIFISQQKIGVWRYKEILESESLSYHYSVKMKKISNKEIRRINDEMKNIFIAYVKKYCANINEFQEQLNSDIKNSNKIMIKRNCIGKISRFIKKFKNEK